MRKFIAVPIFILLSVIVLSCNSNPYYTIRSGNINDDDISEPLSEKAEQFEYNLKITNEIVEHFKKRNFKIIYDKYFSNEIRNRVTYRKFSKSWNMIFREFGKIKSFKPLQWHFITMHRDNQDLLHSIKIVHHEEQSFNYILIFDNNNRNHLVNFSVKLRKKNDKSI